MQKIFRANNVLALFVLLLFLNFNLNGWIAIIPIWFICIFAKKLLCDINVILTFVFSILYVTISLQEIPPSHIALLIFGLPIIYIVGFNFGKERFVWIQRMVSLCLIAVSFMATISTIRSIYDIGVVNLDRDVVLVGTGKTMSATGVAAFVGMIVPLFVAVLQPLPQPKKPLQNIILRLAIGVMVILSALHLGSRTLFVLVFSGCIMVFLLSFSRYKALGKLLIALLLIGTLGASSIFMSANREYMEVFESRIENSDEYGASSLGGRLPLAKYVVSQLPNHFFGSIQMPTSGSRFAHNLWLDIARVSGVIPLILMLVISINFLKALLNVYRSSKIGWELKIMIVVSGFLLVIQCFIEPIIEGCIMLLLYKFFLFGLCKSLQRR